MRRLERSSVALTLLLVACADDAGSGGDVPPQGDAEQIVDATVPDAPGDTGGGGAADAPGPVDVVEAPDSGSPADAGDAGDAGHDPIAPTDRWWRGNVHSHSAPTSFDCTGTPARSATHDDVAAWYRSHGWDFFVFTEHDAWEDRVGMSEPGFLVINGLELSTDGVNRVGPIHVGAIGLGGMVDVPPDMHGKIAEVRFEGGIPIVNHPGWSIERKSAWDADERTAAEDIFHSTASHMEIFNTKTHRIQDDRGIDERIWDDLLARGKRMLGVVSDDSHGFEDIGGGWIMVFAPELSREAVMEAIREGRFYGSSGVRIQHIRVADGELLVESDAYSMEVIGQGGRLLAEVAGGSVSYDLAGQGLVRVRGSRPGASAWTQAYSDEMELRLGAPPEPTPPPEGDPGDPAVLVVEDALAGPSSDSYPGADIHEIVATLPDGTLLRPSRVVPGHTRILDPGGESRQRDPERALDGDDLICGGPGAEWAGFVSLGGLGGSLGVAFDRRLPPGTRVRVIEVDPAVCPAASPNPEGYRVVTCLDEVTERGDCLLLGECPRGGVCSLTL